ncbi:PREDICTED: UPF0503 protein At3g09070, chloroplastic-like [Brassica oleracea var. oleracea]|uniref:UPF0503 protein At3g09070, chloroplastic-like n=1 Tax=Brassica oleracea var. oleracea TaxID=109376 RepID=UPI0006A6A43A|nr:PREDICTED: UPF0503 protein At3g09070, chloroplastic-like [Brassica oleracea var. oleracea]
MTHRTQRRRRRHSSVCHRHPTSKPTAGLCAACLRERLSTIESLSSDQVPELRRVRDASAAQEEDEGRASRRLLEEETEDGDGEKKTMKEFIDLESKTHQIKKNDVASVLTRTLKKLSLKLPMNGNNEDTSLRRSSCDVDPRLPQDLGGISLEEARASWDGCLTGKTYPKLVVPLSAVTEEEKDPGGTAQTRDYYFDSRRRRSFDRSLTTHGMLEVDELKGKLSPEAVGLFHGAKLLVTERELRDSNWYSIEPESLQLASKGVDCVAAGEVKKSGKKWPKGWNLWGLIQRKTDAVKKENKTDAMEGPFVESLLKLRRVVKGESNGDVSEKLMRSYSVSARKSCDGMFHGASIADGFQGGRSSCDGLFHGSVTGVETVRRRRSSCDDGFFHSIEGKRNHLLQRDAKLGSYSPDNLRNSMVRFYLTPVKSHTTSNSGKSRLIH